MPNARNVSKRLVHIRSGSGKFKVDIVHHKYMGVISRLHKRSTVDYHYYIKY
jgi:hypothetical protein